MGCYRKGNINLSKKMAIIVLCSTAISTTSFFAVKYISNKDYIIQVAATKVSVDEFEQLLSSKKYVLKKNISSNFEENELDESKLVEELKFSIVQDEVIYQIATQEGIVVKTNEIEKEFAKYQNALKLDSEYKKYVEDNSISDDVIKKFIEKDLVSKKYINKKLRNTEITEQEIKNYYEKNKKDIFTVDEVKVSHILLKTQDINRKDFTEEEKQATFNKLSNILSQAQSGKNFNELAKVYSEDEGSASLGGNLGYISKGVFNDVFEENVLNISVGEYSDVFETDFGYHIAKVEDKRETIAKYDNVKSTIENFLKLEKVKKDIENLIKEYPVSIYR